ncbi:hypothetical protein Vadar_003734 [Vaccinium darrowii]|uniref:Uncharacterized protein n=1 Tax=Vaccinium darrowii TaxID=229202 RepID=A0ACB7YJE5_9ERIC|nr:hypothetical protein Vadar_003734 [Vaccinium darrowii]
MKLKQQIPSKPKAHSTSEANSHRPNDYSHRDSTGMRHILSRKKEIIKKRFMFDWWIEEDFVVLVTDSEQTAEELANYVFSELLAKGFIESFSEKCTLDCLVNKCRVNPIVCAALIALARKAKFFDFDDEGRG